jgi:SAM-dependent methyltransferase
MLEAEFDAHSQSYREQHQASISFGGFELDYFAQYKADVTQAACARAGLNVADLIDFGAGIGNAVKPLRSAFPDASITCVDVSADSLAQCAAQGVPNCQTQAYDGRTLPFANASIDLAFTACVFHHIPEEQHISLLTEIRRSLKPGGMMVLFEHNPINPLTQLAVARCPFDENAILIRAGEMKRRFCFAGFRNVEAKYRIFFPGFMSALRGIEPWLERIPLGGQYYVTAHA